MSFEKDLQLAQTAEQLVADYLRERDCFSHVRLIGATLTDGTHIRDLQRIAGDIRALHIDTDKGQIRFEVKRDKSANRTGNLFLERWSDNGSRSGKKTVGWFCNEEAQYDYYAFVIVNRGTLFVKRQELKDLVNTVKPRVLDMSYNQTQWNRSDGYIVSISQVLGGCKSARIVEGLWK